MEFYQTVMGNRFFEATLPRISDNLGRIADALERQGVAKPEIDSSDYTAAFMGNTPDETLERALRYLDSHESSEENIFIDMIMNELNSDHDCDDHDLVELYLHTSKEHRAVMDMLLVYLCGWSFGTIIEKCLERSDR